MFVLIILSLNFLGSVTAIDHIDVGDSGTCWAMKRSLEELNKSLKCSCFELEYE